jgi:tetratricopeptide (TPR) repeat protein
VAEPSSRLEQLRRRVRSDPAPFVFAQLAQEYVNGGQPDEAIACCRTLLERHPRYFNAHLILGRALAALGRLREALSELELVLSIAPDHLAAMKDLADVYERLQQPTDALRCYRQALDLAREDRQILMAIDRLSTETSHAGRAASGAAESSGPPSVDLDAVLDRLGYPDQPVPPLVETLLTAAQRLLPRHTGAGNTAWSVQTSPATPDQWSALEDSIRSADLNASDAGRSASLGPVNDPSADSTSCATEIAGRSGRQHSALAALERWLAALLRERSDRDADSAS